ncbi:MAG: hypothetical protein V1821_02105 [bacterium]
MAKHSMTSPDSLKSGYKNSEDRFDEASWAEIELEVEKEMRRARHKVKVEVSETLSSAEKKLLSNLKQLAEQISDRYQTAFLEVLNEYEGGDRILMNKVVEYFRQHDYGFPSFLIADSEHGNQVLEKLGYSKSLHEGNMLFLFQLPSVLAQYWWKQEGQPKRGNSVVRLRGSAIEWGRIYDYLMPEVWEEIDDQSLAALDRINPAGKHEPKEYYYLWKATE